MNYLANQRNKYIVPELPFLSQSSLNFVGQSSPVTGRLDIINVLGHIIYSDFNISLKNYENI